VWISFFSNGSSILRRRYRMYTSITFEKLSKFMSQTCSEIMVRVTTSPAWRARYSSSANSF